jgi:hypothetical protein
MTFVLKDWKDNSAVASIGQMLADVDPSLTPQNAFQFTFAPTADGGVTLTFDLSPWVYEKGLDGAITKDKNNSLKFKDSSLMGFDGVFTNTSNLNWDNDGWTPSQILLSFVGDYTWEQFVDFVFDNQASLSILAHVQSLAGGSSSINGGKFLFGLQIYGNDDSNTATPEPATLAVLGLGLAGLGLARARRRK